MSGQYRIDELSAYPFQRLQDLLSDLTPPESGSVINLSIGEPQGAPPAFIQQAYEQNFLSWHKYPPVWGTEDLRHAIKGWLDRRYGLAEDFISQDQQIVPMAGSREGLFFLSLAVTPNDRQGQPPVVLLPNPFYQPYRAGALYGNAVAHYLPCDVDGNYMPDFEAVDPDILRRTVMAFFCSPSNPQGAVASRDYLEKAVAYARKYDFLLVADECYADIYDKTPPVGILEVCQDMGAGLDNVVAFHSLSKRSNVPGMRSGFAVGDSAAMERLARLLSYGGAGIPLPSQAASVALWQDDDHVVTIREKYRQNFDLVDRYLNGKLNYTRPAAGFFLWAHVDDGEAFTRKVWQEAGIRLLPGAYLGYGSKEVVNPGEAYVRMALVYEPDIIEQAMQRLSQIL